MPLWAWDNDVDLSFTDLVTVYCVFDSGVQTSVQTIGAAFNSLNAVNTDTMGIYARFYATGDTPDINGTGYFVPSVNPDPLARGLETPPYALFQHWLASGADVVDPAPPHQRVQVMVYPRGGGGSSFPKQFSLKVSGSWGGDLAPIYCLYGTRTFSDVQYVMVITAGAIEFITDKIPQLKNFGTILQTLIGTTWVPGTVCAGPAPPIPVWTADDFILGSGVPSPSGFAKALQLWAAVNWKYFCQCVPAPGGSAPAKEPPPPYVQPDQPFIPTPPAPINCDTNELCAMLNVLSRQLASVAGQVAFLRNDVTLIQRQGVPFGYSNRTIHAGLIGDGEFPVSELLGLAVTFLYIPSTFPPISGDPLTYHQVGKISVGTADGWLRSWQPTHSPYLILDVSGAVTKVGYTFPPGIIASITELARAP